MQKTFHLKEVEVVVAHHQLLLVGRHEAEVFVCPPRDGLLLVIPQVLILNAALEFLSALATTHPSKDGSRQSAKFMGGQKARRLLMAESRGATKMKAMNGVKVKIPSLTALQPKTPKARR